MPEAGEATHLLATLKATARKHKAALVAALVAEAQTAQEAAEDTQAAAIPVGQVVAEQAAVIISEKIKATPTHNSLATAR